MKLAVLAGVATVLLTGAGIAQTNTTSPGTVTGQANPPTAATGSSSRLSGPTNLANAAAPAGSSEEAAAADNNDQAVATSGNADTPANGLTQEQAKSRLESKGFSNVGDLKKDKNGVWRGTAEKGGAKTQVWLDHNGDSGISQ